MIVYIIIGILFISIVLLILVKRVNSSDYIGENLINKIFGKQDKNEYIDSKEFKEKYYRDNYYDEYIDPYTKDYDGYQDLRDEDERDTSCDDE